MAVFVYQQSDLVFVNESSLSKRERQMMDIIFQLGSASAADVHERLPDRPTYTAVRTILRILEDKGLVDHHQEGRRYIYTPCQSPRTEGRSAMTRVLDVFFGGSLEDALAAHLSDPSLQLETDELKRLRAIIDDAAVTSKPHRKKKSERK